MSKLYWTTETPTEQGWYFGRRSSEDDLIKLVLISGIAPFFNVNVFSGATANTLSSVEVEYLHEWCRIPIPEDQVKEIEKARLIRQLKENNNAENKPI